MGNSFVVLIALSWVIAPAYVRAQEPPAATLFQQIFPQPTGQNGYEEIVAAGEMLGRSALLGEAENAATGALPLSKKRELLADPPVRDGLILFRRGLAKPLRAPRDQAGGAAMGAFKLYRRIARVVALEQYVHCADGHMGRALDCLEDGLRLGYAVQRDTMLGGLVGVAIDALETSAIQRHLDQLSEVDCRRLVRLARAWRSAPDPALESMAAERELILKRLADGFPADPTFPREQILAGMRARLDQYAANLTKPVWERKAPLPLKGNLAVADYVNSLAQTLDPVFTQAQTLFIRDQVKVQILGVHAAIRLYRWEHDALPTSLDTLNLGPMGVNLYTGKPLQYKVTSPTTYQVTGDALE